ncbi:MAG: hypothetical protein Q8O43_00310 [Dehalococcoidia bacterium]|nr:hypothetical protein [Dehalococcoidia bacterium]
MSWRILSIVLIWLVEALLAFYAGIGYTILLGYLIFLVLLMVPLKTEWLDSKIGRMILGNITRPDIELFLRAMSKSTSYKVTFTVTTVVLLVAAVVIIVNFNYRLIELV